MEKREKKSSLKITLALIGTVALANTHCGENGYRNIYKTKADCQADWSSGNCEDIPQGSSDYYSGRYYGPYVSSRSRMAGQTSHASKSVGISSVSRGGFGSSSSSHSSGRS